MKIGDRIFVRGYIDEIRKDTVIVRNDGGYFGTVPSEVITGELPSAQPEKRTQERMETHGVCSDTISRQAAIDAIVDRYGVAKWGRNPKTEELVWTLERLPPSPNAPKTLDSNSQHAQGVESVEKTQLSGEDATFDCISKKDAIRIVDGIDTWQAGWRGDAIESIKALPSAQPETHEKRTETHACDLISRKMAIDVIRKWKSYETTEGLVVRINNLPSALQRTGRWIDHVEDGYVECPFCHSATNCDDNISDLHFCFSCGARMEGEQK